MYHLLYPLRNYLIVSGDDVTNIMTADGSLSYLTDLL